MRPRQISGENVEVATIAKTGAKGAVNLIGMSQAAVAGEMYDGSNGVHNPKGAAETICHI